MNIVFLLTFPGSVCVAPFVAMPSVPRVFEHNPGGDALGAALRFGGIRFIRAGKVDLLDPPGVRC